MKTGRYNVAVGLFAMVLFMAYGFVLLYLRDFHPEREAWIANYATGEHFQSRMAHAHGNLFGLLNVVVGVVLGGIRGHDRGRKVAAGLGLAGLLMPTGILLEVYFGAPPYPVMAGGAAMVGAIVTSAWLAWQSWEGASASSQTEESATQREQ